MKNILAIYGSPRRKNTAKALDFLLDGLDQENYNIERYYIDELDISPCIGCEYCNHRGVCRIDDQMQDIYESINRADIVVLGAPLYFNSVNAQVKALIDRCQVYWSRKFALKEPGGKKKIGICISTGGAPYRYDQFLGIFPVVDFFFKAIDGDYLGNYFISDTDRIKVKDRLDLREELNEIGRNIENFRAFTIQR